MGMGTTALTQGPAMIRNMWAGQKAMRAVGRGLMNPATNGAAARVATAYGRVGLRTAGTGALYGAGLGAAATLGNNVLNGDSPFSGVMGATVRGGMYGAGAGFAGGALNWAGRRPGRGGF